jgi:hypothetical protein
MSLNKKLGLESLSTVIKESDFSGQGYRMRSRLFLQFLKEKDLPVAVP